MTKESGRLPALGVGCSAHAGSGNEDLRGAYAIHKRGLPRHPHVAVFVAELTMRALCVLEHVAGADLARDMWYVGYGPDMETVMMERYSSIARSICRGAYTSTEGCTCTSVGAVECGALCPCCALTPVHQSVFVEQNRFLGVFPHLSRGWFRGVTDGIETAEEASWMRYGYKGSSSDGGDEATSCVDGCRWE